MKIMDIIGNQDVNMYLRDKIGLRVYMLTDMGPERVPTYFSQILHFFPGRTLSGNNNLEYADLQNDIMRLKGFIEIAGGR